MPDWRLSFYLPTLVGFGLVAGAPTGVIGVSIGEHARIDVAGRNRDFVFKQAADFIDRITRGHDGLVVTATLWRGDEPSPTLAGAVRRGYRVSHEFVVVRGPAVVLAQPYDKPMVYPAKAR